MFYILPNMATRALGELEFMVLWSVGQLGNDAYGAEIRRDVGERLKRDYSVGAIYASLKRLEDKGLLTSHESEPLPVRGGRSRRHFTMTSPGKTALRNGLAIRTRMLKSLNPSWRRA